MDASLYAIGSLLSLMFWSIVRTIHHYKVGAGLLPQDSDKWPATIFGAMGVVLTSWFALIAIITYIVTIMTIIKGNNK